MSLSRQRRYSLGADLASALGGLLLFYAAVAIVSGSYRPEVSLGLLLLPFAGMFGRQEPLVIGIGLPVVALAVLLFARYRIAREVPTWPMTVLLDFGFLAGWAMLGFATLTLWVGTKA